MWTLSPYPNAKLFKERNAASIAKKLGIWPTTATKRDAIITAISEEIKEGAIEETTVGDLEETGEEEGTTSTEIVQTIKDRRIDHTTTTDHHLPHPSKIDLQKSDASHLP